MLDLRVTSPLTGAQGELVGYAVYCPGCGRAHLYGDGWDFNGNLHAPTFRPALEVTSTDESFRCLSYVTDGKIRFLEESTHGLAGETCLLYPIHREIDDS